MHVSSIVARMLSKFIKGFHGIYVNEARNVDMLACACALGVSSSFAAPIGGIFTVYCLQLLSSLQNFYYIVACEFLNVELFFFNLNLQHVSCKL